MMSQCTCWEEVHMLGRDTQSWLWEAGAIQLQHTTGEKSQTNNIRIEKQSTMY